MLWSNLHTTENTGSDAGLRRMAEQLIDARRCQPRRFDIGLTSEGKRVLTDSNRPCLYVIRSL